MGTVTVDLPCNNRIAINTEGRIDHNAEYAFTRGQCHALALALHRLTGWELYGLYNSDWAFENGETPEHVVVLMPNGDYLDINGNNALENWRESWPDSEPHAVTEKQVLGFEHIDYRRPSIDAAMPFALTLWAMYGKECKAQAIQRWLR
jgi:hypothetical protein